MKNKNEYKELSEEVKIFNENQTNSSQIKTIINIIILIKKNQFQKKNIQKIQFVY